MSISMLLLAVILLDNGYGWHTEVRGSIVQYGIASSDDRALRIDCEPNVGLVILGPAGAQLDESRPTEVVFRHRERSLRIRGMTIAMGDGINFTAPVQPDSLPIATLLAGAPLTIENEGASWTVPGEGAPAELGPLVQACRKISSRS
jgi:hypothetical protein